MQFLLHMFLHTLCCCFIEVVKVLVSSGEDPDQTLSLIRLSSYLSQESSDHLPIMDSGSQEATATPHLKPKDSEVGFPFRLAPDDDEEYVLESSNPPATPTIKPIKGSCVIFLYSIIFMGT